jgi:hypothetical protein
MRATVNGIREHHASDGFSFEGHVYQNDNDSRVRIASWTAVAATADMESYEPIVEWRTRDNLMVAMSAATFCAFQKSLCDRDSAVLLNASRLKFEISSARDLTALASVDVYAGWPSTP